MAIVPTEPPRAGPSARPDRAGGPQEHLRRAAGRTVLQGWEGRSPAASCGRARLQALLIRFRAAMPRLTGSPPHLNDPPGSRLFLRFPRAPPIGSASQHPAGGYAVESVCRSCVSRGGRLRRGPTVSRHEPTQKVAPGRSVTRWWSTRSASWPGGSMTRRRARMTPEGHYGR